MEKESDKRNTTTIRYVIRKIGSSSVPSCYQRSKMRQSNILQNKQPLVRTNRSCIRSNHSQWVKVVSVKSIYRVKIRAESELFCLAGGNRMNPATRFILKETRKSEYCILLT